MFTWFTKTRKPTQDSSSGTPSKKFDKLSAEAHDLKAEIEHMELVEQQRHMELREAKIMKGMEKVIAKQVIERNSLKKRLDY